VEDVGEIDAWNPDLLGKGGDGHAGHALPKDAVGVAGIAHPHGATESTSARSRGGIIFPSLVKNPEMSFP
jgi:hypothetical protein